MSKALDTALGATSASDVIGRDKDPYFGEDNPFEAMMARFDHAARLLALDPGIYRVLRSRRSR